MLDALGNPQRAYRVVHVAGTNGKGSTCAMIDARPALRPVDFAPGCSPRRIWSSRRNGFRSTGIAVTPDQFQRAFSVVHETAETLDLDCHPTYFETVTAMGFWLFRELGVETAVVEVGLGGRLDATNVVEPALTVITPVDFDHEIYLGHTLEVDRGGKGGHSEARRSGGIRAAAAGSGGGARPARRRSSEIAVSDKRLKTFEVRDLRDRRARVADFSGIRALPACGRTSGGQRDHSRVWRWNLWASLRRGSQTRDGRAGWNTSRRIPTSFSTARITPPALARWRDIWSDSMQHRKLQLIYGAMRDKAVEEIAGILFPLAHDLIFTAPDYSRALRPEALAEIAGRGETAPSVADALELAREGRDADDVIVITGSLFLVGEARAHVSKQVEPPTAHQISGAGPRLRSSRCCRTPTASEIPENPRLVIICLKSCAACDSGGRCSSVIFRTSSAVTVRPSCSFAPCFTHCHTCARQISAVAASSIRL